MRNEIYYVVTATIKPGRFADFKRVIAPLVAATEQEPGSHAYDYSVDEQESVLHIFESYRDSQAVIDHITGTFAPFADDFGACVDIEGFVVYGHPNAAAREILDGFGSVYMTPFEGFTAASPRE
jgi:quinol monooxygenase YgiN